jgi:hypothetical protein
VTENPVVPYVKNSDFRRFTLTNKTPRTFLLTIIFGGVITHFTSSDPEGSSSISGSILSIAGALRGKTYDVIVTAHNITGSTSYILTITETENPKIPIVKKALGDITMVGKTTKTIALTDIFGGVVDNYSYTSPENSVSISGSILSVTGAYRNNIYNVIVSATNINGSISSILIVTEKYPVLFVNAELGMITLVGTIPRIYDLLTVFDGIVHHYKVSTVPVITPSPFVLNGSILIITGAFRGQTYIITVEATNVVDSIPFDHISSLLTVTEHPPLPTVDTELGTITLGIETPDKTYDLLNVFGGVVDKYIYTDPEGSVSIISGSTLRVVGALRGKSYNTTITATNATGSVSSTLAVTENPVVPIIINGGFGSFTLYDTTHRHKCLRDRLFHI